MARLKKDQGLWKQALDHYEEAFRFSANPLYVFHKGQACENYYRDKQLAINQYKRFLRLSPSEGQYQAFAQERIRLLVEYQHQAGK